MSAHPEAHDNGAVRARLRLIRRHFCFVCDRWTIARHRHADATFSALVSREWRA